MSPTSPAERPAFPTHCRNVPTNLTFEVHSQGGPWLDGLRSALSTIVSGRFPATDALRRFVSPGPKAGGRAGNSESEPPFRCTEAVFAEACFLMRKVHTTGPAEVLALGRKGVYEISLSLEDHWATIESLLRKYADRPVTLADACLIRCAEVFQKSRIVTFDSDFGIYRWGRNKRFEISTPFQKFCRGYWDENLADYTIIESPVDGANCVLRVRAIVAYLDRHIAHLRTVFRKTPAKLRPTAPADRQ